MLPRVEAALLASLLALPLSRLAAAATPAAEDTSLYIETDRDAEKLLEAARAHARAGDWRRAIAGYQRVADYAGRAGAQPLVPLAAGSDVFVPIQFAAALEVAHLPPAARELYREANDLSAKALFEQGMAARDPALLADAARRYLATSWGDDALSALGSLAMERADFVGALWAWTLLLDAHARPSVPLPAILSRMWVARRALGHDDAARAIADKLRKDHPTAKIRAGGRELSVADFLAIPVAPPRVEPRADWPALGGDASHAAIAQGPAQVGGLVWRFALPHPPAALPFAHNSTYPQAMPYHATVSGGRVYIADAANVCVLGLADGRPAWLFPDAPQAGPEPSLDETIHAVACSRGRAFARLGRAVAAFDAATGRMAWRRVFADPLAEPPPEPEAKKEEAAEPPAKKRDKGKKALGAKVRIILTPPVVAGPRVFVGMTHLGEEARASLVALDAATGREVWRTFVCSRSIPAFLSLGATPSPPAVEGGTAYLLTNLGTVAALDARTGAIRWVHRYASFSAPLRRSVVQRRQRWAACPPVVRQGMVVAAPQDAGRLLAIDGVTGSLAWSAPREGARYLVGAEGGRVFTAGPQVVALNILTGTRLWEAALPDATAARPALCSGRLYVPTAKALLAVDTHTGKPSVARLWQPSEAPGNVTAVRGAVLVASSERLYAFGDWDETLAVLAQRRAADPADPLVPLTEGLHAAQRGEHAAATTQLEHALELATKRKDAKTAARAREALFQSLVALGESGDGAALARAASLAPGPEDHAAALLALARLHEKHGRPAAAVEVLQQMLAALGATRCRTEPGLVVRADALACAEIGRILRERGREAYAGVEAKAAKRLAAAKTEAALEAIVRRFPHSVAAERAMVRLLSLPNAHALAPHLTGLAHRLAPEPASGLRATVEARLRRLVASQRRVAAALPRWRVQTRIAHQRVQPLDLPGLPAGYLYFATARRTFNRSMPFDHVECRRADTGLLVWQREVPEWDATALVAGRRLVLPAFDTVVALDPLSGAEAWAVSLPRALAVARPAAPERRPGNPDEPGERRPWRLRLRSEEYRIVGMAVGGQRLYVALAGGHVAALALADGKKLWGRTLDARVLLKGGLGVHAGKVWVCAESPAAIHSFAEADGAPGPVIAPRRDKEAFRLPRLTDRPAWVPAAGRLYVVVDDRSVRAVDLRDGKTLWETYLDFGVSRLLASDDGRRCYVVPDRFLHHAQIVSLDPATGKVLRRRTVLGGTLRDAALAGEALFTVERDNDNAVVVRALDPLALSERWRAVPLPIAQPSRLAVGAGLVAIAGRHAGERKAVLFDAASGRVVGDATPAGATNVSVAIIGDLLVLGSDRGIYAYGPREDATLDRRIAALAARVAAGDRAALPSLAVALYQRHDEKRAADLLARALADETLPDADYAALKDMLNGLREAAAERQPDTLATAYMDVPPNINGAIDEPWRADLAARLDGPAHIHEIQGVNPAAARWRSPSDLSAVLYTGWDSRYFYFAVDVSDDVHRTYTSQGDSWIGDGLIISVDTDNDGGYGYRFTSRDLLLTLALTRKDERRDDEGEDEPGGEYRVRLKEDSSGAVYEIAIPWDYLGIADPRPGLRFGFNVTVTDDDSDRATKAVSWTPGMVLDRDRMLMVRGFTPAHFGDVLLTGRPAGPPPLWQPPASSPPDGAVRVHRIRPSAGPEPVPQKEK